MDSRNNQLFANSTEYEDGKLNPFFYCMIVLVIFTLAALLNHRCVSRAFDIAINAVWNSFSPPPVEIQPPVNDLLGIQQPVGDLLEVQQPISHLMEIQQYANSKLDIEQPVTRRNTIEDHPENTNCIGCSEPIYQFTVNDVCAHVSLCYNCFLMWLAQRKQNGSKMNCPECRQSINKVAWSSTPLVLDSDERSQLIGNADNLRENEDFIEIERNMADETQSSDNFETTQEIFDSIGRHMESMDIDLSDISF